MYNLKIIYEDTDLLVIDKDVGIVVNNSKSTYGITIQDIVRQRIGRNLNESSEFFLRSGIVHRLDKDTSGVLLVAKNEKSFLLLQQQFKKREVIKEYIALVHGKVSEDNIEINAPLKRNPNDKRKFAIVKNGREALTLVEKIKEVYINGTYFTLLKVFPKTGRTHQVRVHLSATGHPIVGDNLYLGKQTFKKDNEIFGRLILHALKLTITHPTKNVSITFEAPLPEIFKKLNSLNSI